MKVWNYMYCRCEQRATHEGNEMLQAHMRSAPRERTRSLSSCLVPLSARMYPNRGRTWRRPSHVDPLLPVATVLSGIEL